MLDALSSKSSHEGTTSFNCVRKHVFDAERGELVIRRPGAKFIWAKIPFDWMWQANRLPGKASHVGLALWFLAGVKKTMTFKLTAEAVDLAGCGRKSLYAGLASLERGRLISVTRRLGARPVVTILTLTTDPNTDEQL
ncbi:hypothetical protein [Uliginosibacterium sp. 31-12]|uniref:hypothetical protein n=1 Tax=Uliginosibacterium sp. 31-12 TaxID=3062781 RepID=UPI0026E13E14|nr:hypothetical protein [Uliginosibacterium sp. 31-12]MDO6384702.1 hypothetical protein [Uliginosibacterium sp. 31-12]